MERLCSDLILKLFAKMALVGPFLLCGCFSTLLNETGQINPSPTPSDTSDFNPAQKWISPNGDLYFSDTNNCVVRKFSAETGNITTVAGNQGLGCGDSGNGGLATDAQLNYPLGVALDSSGNLYIADTYNSIVRRVDAVTQVITSVAGTSGMSAYSGDSGLATAAELYNPYDLVLDRSGNIYIADMGNSAIRKVDHSTQVITTIAGGTLGMSGDGGPAVSAELGRPQCIAMDQNENLVFGEYIYDTMNSLNRFTVRKINATTGILTTLAGGGPGADGEGGPALSAYLNYIGGIAVDSSNLLHVSDTYRNAVRKVDSSQVIQTIAGVIGTNGYNGDGAAATASYLYGPNMITFDSNGHLYIVDTSNEIIRKVDGATGLISTIVGTPQTSGYSGDGGAATSAELNRPAAISQTFD